MSDNKVQIQITAEDLASAVVAGISTAFEQMKRDLAQLAPAAKQAGDAISAAFNTLGVKSSASVNAEQKKLIDAFNQLKNSGTASAMEIAQAQNNLRNKLKELDEQANKTGSAMHKMSEANVSGTQSSKGMFDIVGGLAFRFNAVITAVQTTAAALMSLAEPAMAFEKIGIRMKSATGSAQEAAIAMTFVKELSLKLGMDVETTADSFTKLALATKNTSVEGKATRTMFEGFMTMFSGLRLSADESNRAFIQISQGFNKGKFELEDLKSIAEAGIPIFDLLAQSMGKPRPEIMKMVSDGEILGTAMVGVAEAGKKAFGKDAEEAAKSTAGSIATLKNEFKLAKAALGDDLMPVIAIGIKGLHALTVGTSGLVEMVKIASMTFGAFAQSILDIGAAIADGSILSPKGLADLKNRLLENGSLVKKYFMEVGRDGKQAYQTTDAAAQEAEINEKRRQKEAQDRAKLKSAYIKQIADEETRLREKENDDYIEKKGLINSHYEAQLQTVKKGSAEYIALEAKKADELNALERNRATVSAQINTILAEKRLALTRLTGEQEIAVIESSVQKKTISEEQGAAQIAAIRKKQADAELTQANQRLSILAVAGKQGTDEYKKAIEEQIKAQQNVTKLIIEDTKLSEKARKDSIDNALAHAKNAYQDDLNSLQESENAGTVTRQEASLRRLQLARDEAEAIAAIRSKELSDINPATQQKEYEAALAKKLDADRAYLTAKKAVLKEEAEQLAKHTQNIVNADQEWRDGVKARYDGFMKETREVALGWGAMWDAAYNNASASMRGLSDAAYNTFAAIQGLPLKTIESLEALRLAAQKAGEEHGKLQRIASDVAITMPAAWGESARKLAMISTEAARIKSEFMQQKVAAEELAVAIQKPTTATSSFLQQIEYALKNMGLLDNATLDKLKGSIQKIKDEMIAFTDRIRDALKSLQDEWDNMSMSKLELEEKRYQEQRLKWQNDYDEAKRQGNDEAIKALYQQLELIEKINKTNVTELLKDKNNTVSPLKRAIGGWIPGIGSSDTVPAMLTPGEFVIRKSAAAFFGNDFLHAINNLRLPVMGFNAGGMVPAVTTGASMVRESGGAVYNITINNTDPIGDIGGFVRRKLIPELMRFEARKA